MIMLAALLVAPLAGWLIKEGNGWLDQPYLGYQAVFALAFLTGLVGTVCFVLIPEPHQAHRPRPTTGTTTGLWSVVAGNRAFLGLIVSGFVWNLALQVAAPFFNVYLVRHLGAQLRMNALQAFIRSSGSSAAACSAGSWTHGRLPRPGRSPAS
jgi:Na+/melibiose symporter-like transporter